MILETDRLILRKYVEEDFDALFEIVVKATDFCPITDGIACP